MVESRETGRGVQQRTPTRGVGMRRLQNRAASTAVDGIPLFLCVDGGEKSAATALPTVRDLPLASHHRPTLGLANLSASSPRTTVGAHRYRNTHEWNMLVVSHHECQERGQRHAICRLSCITTHALHTNARHLLTCVRIIASCLAIHASAPALFVTPRLDE